MKVFLGLLGLILAVSAYEINLKGGYKQNARYIYKYEARIRPAQVSNLRRQFIEFLINCTVEIHPVSHEKFFLQITKHNITVRLSDPKFTNGPVDYASYGELDHLSEHIKKPIRFKYRGGMVREVHTVKGDARFSVNIKKGIINLFHVDINGGKGVQTKSQNLFTKTERSIFGKCQTSYSTRDFKVVNSRRVKENVGFNITKVIDLNNCTESDFEVFNKVIPGPNDNQATNPMKSSGTIKYNILGTKDAFKVDEVHATGLHILYLTSEDDRGIESVTEQRLKLVKRLTNPMKKSKAASIEETMQAESLSMNVKSFGNIERIPELSLADKTNIVKLVKSKLTVVTKLLPNFETMNPTDIHIYLEDVSTEVLHVIHIIRTIDRKVHTTIWKECSKDTKMMKWLVYVYSLCGTQECTLHMQKAVVSLKDNDLIAHYLWTSSFNGNPTLDIVNSYKEILKSETVKSSAELTRMAYLSATNVIKTYCTQAVCNSTWIDEILTKALQYVRTKCKSSEFTCHPLGRMPATVVMALVENIQRPGLFPHLKRIVLDESLPLHVRVKALSALRPLAMIIPNKVRPLMLRIFRDRSCDKELRILGFATLMDNPSVHVILHVAREINNEPIRAVRRFVYDKWIGMLSSSALPPRINTAVRLALALFSKKRLPSRLGSLTNCYHAKLHSDKLAVATVLRHEEIYRTNFLPTSMHSKLNVTILGRNISVLEAQLRVEGLEEYLGRVIGSKRLMGKKSTKKNPLEKISEVFKRISDKLPTFSVPESDFRLFTQMSVFDKIFHVDEMSSSDTATGDDKLKKKLPLAERLMKFGSLGKKLEKGLEHRYSKPLIPVEAIYRMPSLVGVTMTANLTTMLIPVSVSKITLTTAPKLYSLKLLVGKRINSMEMASEQKLCAIADVHGVINFGIPSLELGTYMRTTLNISATLKGSAKYDHKTSTFESHIEAPETASEVITLKKNAYYYLKHDGKQMKLKTDEDKSTSREKIHREKKHVTEEGEEDQESSGFSESTIEGVTPSTKEWGSSVATVTPTEPLSTATAGATVEGSSSSKIQQTVTSASITPMISAVSTSVKQSSIPEIPTTPTNTSGKEKVRVETENVLKIPIDLDGWKDLEVIGLEKEAPRSEELMLKINGRFVSVRNGKVVLSNVPTVVKVKFYGKDERIVRLSLLNHGFLTAPKNSPCLIAKKEKLYDGQFFVITKQGPNLATIQAVAHMKPRSVPKEWSIAEEDETKALEDMEELFHEEMVPLPDQDLDEEEKIQPSSQKARLTYLTVNDDSVCLTPVKNKAAIVTTVVKTSRLILLRRTAYQNGICSDELFGVRFCLHGIRPHPVVDDHLLLAYSPMEYRVRLVPVSSKPGHFSVMVVDDEIDEDDSRKSSLWRIILSHKSESVEQKIVVAGNVDWVKMNGALTITPSEMPGLEFSKLCLGLNFQSDQLSLAVSFDQRCTSKNLDVDFVSSKHLPRYSMTFNNKHKSKRVPSYVEDALIYVIKNVAVPALRSTVYVYPSQHLSEDDRDTSRLDISLVRNDTIRLHLRTAEMSYLLNDVKIPTVLKSLPVGTPQIPLVAKLKHLVRPQCLHQDKTFVTFDKNQYHFAPRGKCEHTLLRICDKRKSNIAVTTKRIDGTLKRAVTVVVNSQKIEIIPKERMNLKPTIKINDSQLRFAVRHLILYPGSNEKMLTLIWEPKIKCLTVIHHKNDLVVKLTRSHRVSVRISPLFVNKTCGLCGNYNGEKFDDFLTPEGALVNDARRSKSFYSVVRKSAAKVFASSWIASDTKCTSDCHFTRKFIKVLSRGRVCLTNYPIVQCSCTQMDHGEKVEVPATCVPPSMADELKKFLTDGKQMDLSKSTMIMTKVEIPKQCKCSC